MKKIAVLTCLKSNDVCTRAACLKAFYGKTGYFSQYKDEEIQLAALWTCQGCKRMKLCREGLREKLASILDAEITAVHIGVCCRQKTKYGGSQKCRYVKRIEKWLLAHHVQVMWGTHT